MSGQFSAEQIQFSLVLLILILTVVGFVFEIFRSDVVAFVSMCALIVSGVISASEAISGFSNEATITVTCLYIISAGFVRAGGFTAMNGLFRRFGSASNGVFRILLMLVAATGSAFFNNTAAVAVLIPNVIKEANRRGADVRSLLMPLSYAAIFGGACTMIGTSTNLIANSILKTNTGKSFELFDIFPIGFALSLAGIVYLSLGGLRLLTRKEGHAKKNSAQYLTEVQLLSDSPSIGVPFKESPLYRDFHEQIYSVRRENKAIEPNRIAQLLPGDRVQVLTTADAVLGLKNRSGVELASYLSKAAGEEKSPSNFHEVVIPSNSSLSGLFLYELAQFGIHPIAIRHTRAFSSWAPERFEIRPGDILILEGQSPGLRELSDSGQIVFLNQLEDPEVNLSKFLFVVGVAAAMILAAAAGLAPISSAALVACSLLLLSRIMTIQEAYKSIDTKVIVLIACVLSLGLALQKVGAIALMSDLFTRHSEFLNPIFLPAILFLLTSVITETISNSATVALLTPLAIQIAPTVGVSERPLVVAVMVAASSSFLTPIGYQTNTMIYSAGGFKFKDFLRVGAPLNLIFWILASILIPIFYPL